MISIHARLALSLLVGSAVLYGVGGWWLDGRVHRTLEAQHDAALVSRAWALANALQGDEGKIELEAVHGITAALQVSSRPLYFEVWRSDGSVAGRSPTLGTAELPRFGARGDEPRVIDVTLPPDGRPGRAAGIEMELFDEPGEDESAEATLDAPAVRVATRAPIDHLTIVVAEDSRDLDAAMGSLRGNVTAFAVLSFVSSALYLGWSLRRGLAPLNELSERARTLEARSLRLGIGHDALPRELAPLRDRLNELLERVQRAFTHEQQFTASLAHELRTPVAELRTLAEVALRRDATTADRQLQEDVLTVSLRMQAVIEALLALRRAETDADSINFERVALDELVREILAENESSASRKGVRCVCLSDDGVFVTSNEGLLRAIVGNLVRNAIEYSPTGKRVTATIVFERGVVWLSIHNEAPDLTADDLAQMFEPFWRKAGTDSTAGHTGVGLTLARALARALDCELTGELHADACVSMRLSGLRVSAD